MFTCNLQTAEAQSIKFTVYAYDSVNGPSAKVGRLKNSRRTCLPTAIKFIQTMVDFQPEPIYGDSAMSRSKQQ